MVIKLPAQVAVAPAGRPVASPMPRAPVVACVMVGSTTPMHIVGLLEGGPTVLAVPEVVTVMVPVAADEPQAPKRGIL